MSNRTNSRYQVWSVWVVVAVLASGCDLNITNSNNASNDNQDMDDCDSCDGPGGVNDADLVVGFTCRPECVEGDGCFRIRCDWVPDTVALFLCADSHANGSEAPLQARDCVGPATPPAFIDPGEPGEGGGDWTVTGITVEGAVVGTSRVDGLDS